MERSTLAETPVRAQRHPVTLRRGLCILLAGLLTLNLPVHAGAGLIASPESGWPQWRGPCRDGISPETGLRTQWPEAGPPLLWQVQGLGRGWCSPIVVGRRLYLTGDVGADLIVYALDHRGNRLWEVKNGRSWQGPYPGARASCVYAKGRLYHLNAHGRVVCLNADEGTEIWSVNPLTNGIRE